MMVDLTHARFRHQRRHPVSRVARELAPWTWAGLAIMFATGPLNLASEAQRCYDSSFFWIKMGLIVMAVTFHFTVHRRVTMCGATGLPIQGRTGRVRFAGAMVRRRAWRRSSSDSTVKICARQPAGLGLLPANPFADDRQFVFEQPVYEQSRAAFRNHHLPMRGLQKLLRDARDRRERAEDRSSLPRSDSPQGFRCSPSCVQVSTSQNSSKVPKPPGIAMNASDNSAIIAFRSCIEPTTRRSGIRECETSRSSRACGITPMISPPASSVASASSAHQPDIAPAVDNGDPVRGEISRQ